MDRNVSLSIVIALLVLTLLGMLLSWYRRKRRQSDLDILTAAPADLGAVLATESGLYLASTPTGDRLNRIAVGGLGFRARLTTVVAETGILLPFPGGSDVFIPASAVLAAGTASWTIDRGMQPDGLSVVSWRLGDTAVDSYFRFDEPDAFENAVRHLVPITTAQAATQTQTQNQESDSQ